MTSATSGWVVAAIGLAVVGCSGGSSADPQDSSEADLISGNGVAFAAAADSALKVNVKVADGLKPSTKNKRFIRLTVARGSKSFGMWCTAHGQIGALGPAERIQCDEGTTTVSNDDDESFSMTLAHKGGAYAIESVDYVGDGTFFGNRMRILQPGWEFSGGTPDPLENVALKVTKGEHTEADPFAMTVDVGARLHDLLGMMVSNDETSDLPVQSITFNLSNKMETDVSLLLMKKGTIRVNATKRVSVLRTAGDLASGYASTTEMKQRVSAKLP